MERALRVITVERGHDPRLFTLVAFGGAGALHAAELAAALGIRRVYVPRQPGLLSAWGVLAAELVRDHGRTLRAVAPTGGVLERGFRALARAAERDLRREGVRPATVERLLEVRYAGQAYEVSVPYRAGWERAFHRAHARLFGHADPRRPVEVVTLRARARGGGARLPTERPPRAGRPAPLATRPVAFAEGARRAAVHRRDDLGPGRRLRGPAVICEYSATTLVPPGWRGFGRRLGGVAVPVCCPPARGAPSPTSRTAPTMPTWAACRPARCRSRPRSSRRASGFLPCGWFARGAWSQTCSRSFSPTRACRPSARGISWRSGRRCALAPTGSAPSPRPAGCAGWRPRWRPCKRTRPPSCAPPSPACRPGPTARPMSSTTTGSAPGAFPSRSRSPSAAAAPGSTLRARPPRPAAP